MLADARRRRRARSRRARSAAITPISLRRLLEVGERFLVLEVVALEEQLDAAAEDAEAAVGLALDRVAALAGRAVDAVLDLELGGLGRPRVGGGRRTRAAPARIAWRSSSSPSPVAEETASTSTASAPSRSRHSAIAAPTSSGGSRSRLESTTSSGRRVEAGAVGGELGAHRLVVGDRVALQRRQVDEVDEHRAALDVGEELVAEAGALGGALDQARDVGEHRLAVLALDRPEAGESVVNG